MAYVSSKESQGLCLGTRISKLAELKIIRICIDEKEEAMKTYAYKYEIMPEKK